MNKRLCLLVLAVLVALSLSGCKSVAQRQAEKAIGVGNPATIADGEVQNFLQRVTPKIEQAKTGDQYPESLDPALTTPGVLDKFKTKKNLYISKGDSYCLAAWDVKGGSYKSEKAALAYLSQTKQLVAADTTSGDWCDASKYAVPSAAPSGSPSTPPAP